MDGFEDEQDRRYKRDRRSEDRRLSNVGPGNGLADRRQVNRRLEERRLGRD